MLVKCICNEAKYAFKKEMPLGTSYYSKYSINIGECFFVMGILNGKGFTQFMIDDRGYILIYPIELFEIVDNRMLGSWYFSIFKNDSNLYYKSIVASYQFPSVESHVMGLIEQKKHARDLYFQNKRLNEALY